MNRACSAPCNCPRPGLLPYPLCQGHFPEPDKDPVIQVASLVTEFGKATPTVRNIMTLKSCAPISGAGGLGCRVRSRWWGCIGMGFGVGLPHATALSPG